MTRNPRHDGRVLVAAHGSQVLDAATLSPRQVDDLVSSFYDEIGSREFFTALGTRFYELVALDSTLAPLFPKSDWHVQARRLTAHFIRMWEHNDLTAAWDRRIHEKHSHRVITRAQRLRWLDLIEEAATQVGAPRHRIEELVAVMRIASGEMMAASRGAAIARGEQFAWDGSPR